MWGPWYSHRRWVGLVEPKVAAINRDYLLIASGEQGADPSIPM